MNIHRLAAISSAVVVAVSVTVGLYLSGSPPEQRLLRLDEKRITDLGRLADAIQRYRLEQGELPPRLLAALDGRRLTTLPVDPVSGDAYEYIPAERSFRLCAEFSRASPESARARFWEHEAGRQCFNFDAISPEGVAPTRSPPVAPAMPLG